MFDTFPGSFSEESWENICQQFNEMANVTFHVTEMTRRFAALKKRYDIVKPLYEDHDYAYDPRRNVIDMYDSDWEEVIEVTPELEPYRKHGCPLYDQLEFIFRSDRQPGEYAQHSSGRNIAPNRSNKRVRSEAPNSVPNKKSRAEAEEVPSQTVAQSAAPQNVDIYSVGCCISVINGMQGIDRQLYTDAIDLFKNPCWRETFISLKQEKRLNWLKAMLPKT
ncbi:hypothetical protein QQ045_027123 [Rhodiola kirilowii]